MPSNPYTYEIHGNPGVYGCPAFFAPAYDASETDVIVIKFKRGTLDERRDDKLWRMGARLWRVVDDHTVVYFYHPRDLRPLRSLKFARFVDTYRPHFKISSRLHAAGVASSAHSQDVDVTIKLYDGYDPRRFKAFLVHYGIVREEQIKEMQSLDLFMKISYAQMQAVADVEEVFSIHEAEDTQRRSESA